MINYQNSKIYRLFIEYYEEQDDEKQIYELNYIGATTLSLSKRLGKHKENYKRWIKDEKPENNYRLTSVYLFEKGTPKIELICYYPCNNKEELDKKEGEYIRLYNCVNRNIMGRTRKEYINDNIEYITYLRKKYYEDHKEGLKEKRKIYYDNNKDLILKKNKKYREINKDELKEKNKIYCDNNKDIRLENSKIYYEINKNEIAEKRKERVECGCGTQIRKYDFPRHLKSNLHNDYLKDNLLHLLDL